MKVAWHGRRGWRAEGAAERRCAGGSGRRSGRGRRGGGGDGGGGTAWREDAKETDGAEGRNGTNVEPSCLAKES